MVNWDGGGDPVAPQWAATGGNPDGFIYSADVQGDGFFLAPAAYLGDWSAAYGLTLSYDAYARYTGWKMNDVYIVGNSQTLSLWFPTNPLPQWTHFSVTLNTNAGWQYGLNYDTIGAMATEAQIRSVLSNVTQLRIRQEFAYGTDESGLDNVTLPIVPERNGPSLGPPALKEGLIEFPVLNLLPGRSYELRQTPRLAPVVSWSTALTFLATNINQVLSLPRTNAQMFYRARLP
jgi:hypothetical protein